ncbi:MAG: ABC transporter permease [Actinobacteria bacterium]|nr:ABC transporter permease [Actinomycetota bacterium]
MEECRTVLCWFADPANWSGANGIPTRFLEHVWMSGLSVGIAAALALPVGLFIGHTRRGAFLAISIGNLGRAIPSFAILALALPVTIRLGLGLGFWPTVIALVALAIPPILTNTYAGVAGVDDDTLEAARGMGMREGQLLRRIELPLAAPLVVAGLRTAAVQVVATATLAALVAWGGLGRYIVDGFAQRRNDRVLGGAILVAVLAIVTELVFGLVERAVRPRTESRERRRLGLRAPAAGAEAPGGA